MDLMDPDNPDYKKIITGLGLENAQLAQVANFTNSRYPNIELDFSILDPDSITTNAPAYLKIKITRDVDDEGDEAKEVDTTVHAPFYPAQKMENWWLVVGEESSQTLLAIKRVTFGRQLETKLEFAAPSAPGDHDLKLYLMCDSYVGVDQDPGFKVSVAEGMDEDGDEDEAEEEEE